jgi:hypothetical protein
VSCFCLTCSRTGRKLHAWGGEIRFMRLRCMTVGIASCSLICAMFGLVNPSVRLGSWCSGIEIAHDCMEKLNGRLLINKRFQRARCLVWCSRRCFCGAQEQQARKSKLFRRDGVRSQRLVRVGKLDDTLRMSMLKRSK